MQADVAAEQCPRGAHRQMTDERFASRGISLVASPDDEREYAEWGEGKESQAMLTEARYVAIKPGCSPHQAALRPNHIAQAR